MRVLLTLSGRVVVMPYIDSVVVAVFLHILGVSLGPASQHLSLSIKPDILQVQDC
jgi:hypothetical protein